MVVPLYRWMVDFRENLIQMDDDLGVPLFKEMTPYYHTSIFPKMESWNELRILRRPGPHVTNWKGKIRHLPEQKMKKLVTLKYLPSGND